MFVVCSIMATLFIASCKTPKHINSEENNVKNNTGEIRYTIDELLTKGELKAVRDTNGKYGLIDASLNLVVKPIYDEFRGLGEVAIALVRLDDKWWFINMKTGSIIKENIYDDIKTFNEGLFIVRLGDKKGWIDKELNPAGKGIIYDDVEYFINGFAKVRIDREWFRINKQFEKVDWE